VVGDDDDGGGEEDDQLAKDGGETAAAAAVMSGGDASAFKEEPPPPSLPAAPCLSLDNAKSAAEDTFKGFVCLDKEPEGVVEGEGEE